MKGFKLEDIKDLLGIKSWAKCLCFTLVLFFINFNRNFIDSWISKSLSNLLKSIYSFIDTNILANIILLFLIIYLLYDVVFRNKENRYGSFFLLSTLLFFSNWIIFDKFWTYTNIPLFGIGYNIIISSSLLGWLISIIYHNWQSLQAKKNPLKYNMSGGFEVVTKADDMIDLRWENYASVVADKLRKTDLSFESLACAIVSPWGSGKSTFLGDLRTELTKTQENSDRSFLLIDYNPWESSLDSNENNIVDQFCKTLIEKLGTDKHFVRVLKKYVSIIDNFGLKDWSSWIGGILQEEDDSLSHAKEQIEQHISMKKSIPIMIIDDMDRLTASELMTLLKLIRITANFKHFVYIVAYDEMHVVEMLRRSGFENGREFLKKIFQLRIPLPSYEPFKISDMLRKNLLRLGVSVEILREANRFIYLRNRESFEISNYLPTLRDVKIFANQFALAHAQIFQSNMQNHIDWYELFIAELLLFTDSNVYDLIHKKPFVFLEEKRDALWHLRKDIDIILKKNSSNKESVGYLLNLLFGDKEQVPGRSIRRPEAFLRYFAFRFPEKKIKDLEFKDFCDSYHNVDEVILKYEEWTNRSNRYLSESLYRLIAAANQQRQFNGTDIPINNLVNSILLLININCYHKIDGISALLKDMMGYKYLSEDLTKKLNDQLFDSLLMLVEKLPEVSVWLPLMKMLTCKTTYMDDKPYEPSHISFRGILCNEQLCAISEKLFDIIFGNTEKDIRDVTRSNSKVNEFLINSTYEDSEYVEFPAGENGITHVSRTLLPSNAILKYYGGSGEKPNYEVFQDFVKPIMEVDSYELENSPEPVNEIYLNRVEIIFGNLNFYERFITECFDLKENQIQKHLKKFKAASH